MRHYLAHNGGSLSYDLKSVNNIGVARILSAGVHFFAKKVGRPFFSRRRLNIPPNLSHPAKIDSRFAWWGCTSCPAGVHLHIFPVN